jgi:hypothetical protein
VQGQRTSDWQRRYRISKQAHLSCAVERSGAWWLEENGNTMLRLRYAIYNDTFDTVLNCYVAKKRLNV